MKDVGKQRDRHITRAYKHLHGAIDELQKAGNLAGELGDTGFSEALWDCASKVGALAGKLSREYRVPDKG